MQRERETRSPFDPPPDEWNLAKAILINAAKMHAQEMQAEGQTLDEAWEIERRKGESLRDRMDRAADPRPSRLERFTEALNKNP